MTVSDKLEGTWLLQLTEPATNPTTTAVAAPRFKACNYGKGFHSLDGRIILRWVFRKWEGVVGTGWSWLRIGRGGRHL